MSSETKTDGAETKPKKSNKTLIIGAGLGVLLLGGGAGATLAPRFMAPPPAPAKEHGESADKEGHESEDGSQKDSAGDSSDSHAAAGTPPLSVEWPPLVVDVRDEGGQPHHVKLVITIECADEHAQKEVQGFSHRARAKVLEHVRGQTYEELTDGTKFSAIQAHLTKLIKGVSGKSVKSVWITDFVAQ